MADFISADIEKLAAFETQSAEAIAEFDRIKTQFQTINETLLKSWEGEGADAYQFETDNILENIGGIRDVLDGINNGVVKDIKENYLQLDEALDEINRNPSAASEAE